ncbi:hypothetical protein AAZX31_08G279000 [Glycine max]
MFSIDAFGSTPINTKVLYDQDRIAESCNLLATLCSKFFECLI